MTPTEYEAAWQALSEAYGEAVASTKHKPSREWFRRLAMTNYGIREGEFDGWAETRKWSDHE